MAGDEDGDVLVILHHEPEEDERFGYAELDALYINAEGKIGQCGANDMRWYYSFEELLDGEKDHAEEMSWEYWSGA